MPIVRKPKRARVLVVVGTRPEAIKMIPVIQALQKSQYLKPFVVSTGQHADMVAQLMEWFEIHIDECLCVADEIDGRRPTLNEMVGRIISGLDQLTERGNRPMQFREPGKVNLDDLVACLVHGDTSSAMAAAVAAFNLQIPIGHVEAGLRTSNLLSPFPEEGNRQLISRIATLHFSPTEVNKMNLVREGIAYDRIFVTGNTSIDTLRWVHEHSTDDGYGVELRQAQERIREGSRLVLVTAHRRENWGGGIARIADAIAQLSETFAQTQFVVPMHPNPTAHNPLRSALSGRDNVHLVTPRDYPHFANLMRDAALIITDSGGVQEEAPAFHVPVLVTRDTTEREEGLAAGTLKLVGTDTGTIVTEASRLLHSEDAHTDMAGRDNPYGDGRAATRMVKMLEHLIYDVPAPEPYSSSSAVKQAVHRFVGYHGGAVHTGDGSQSDDDARG